MATTLRRDDPQLLDSLIQYGAHATVRSVPCRKRYASAIGVHPTRASRHRRGDTHSPSTKYLVGLALADGGSAWPMISEGIAVVIQQTIKEATIEQLHVRLRELDDIEHDHEAVENRSTMRVREFCATTPEEFEAAARANIQEAELQLERAAILRELAERARRRK